MDATIIRIDAPLVGSHQGKIVKIAGKVLAYDHLSNTATIDSNGPIQFSLNPSQELEVNKIYEIIGKVSTSSLEVNAYSVIRLSDNFNLLVALKLVEYVHKVPELYYK